jgi:hypothetical protein
MNAMIELLHTNVALNGMKDRPEIKVELLDWCVFWMQFAVHVAEYPQGKPGPGGDSPEADRYHLRGRLCVLRACLPVAREDLDRPHRRQHGGLLLLQEAKKSKPHR